ncbi:MAG: hypothetical protein J0I99_16180 [Devosia sp.]|uniref:hypothetical protein n=1 Tax=Devosia sp. TaxID=1871048 RepID=UPI001ACE444E|nr:hypothetical protein [Devosia sp.]MBN9309119.1 hypothetical protein [Devosia sp.]MBN9317282.1 hypothetical protein [Devosia sp.]
MNSGGFADLLGQLRNPGTLLAAVFLGLAAQASDTRGPDAALYLIISVANNAGVLALLYTQVTYAFGEHYLWAVTAPVALSCAGLAVIDRRIEQRLLFLANAALSLVAYTVTLPLAIHEYGWQ